MIKELTPEQEELLDVYKDKWLKVGLSTEPANKEKVEEGIRTLYKISNLEIPKFVWVDSPHAAQEYINKVEGNKEPSYHSNYFSGSHQAGYFSFYDYMINVLKVEVDKDVYSKFLMDQQICENGGWWYPFDEICVCTDRPAEIHLVEEKLHKDGGMAVKYRDGWGIYSLNGIRVPEWLVMTPAEKLDPTLVMKEKNVEIRREILRKIGIERYLKSVPNKTLHADKFLIDGSEKEYELLEFDLGDDKVGRALKMKNPSVPGVYHIEGVPDEINTCLEALQWRNEQEELPIKLT